MKKSNKPKPVKKARAQTKSGETIGIDLGDKTSTYCILNAEGEVIERGSFHNTESSLKKHFGSLMRTRIGWKPERNRAGSAVS